MPMFISVVQQDEAALSLESGHREILKEFGVKSLSYVPK